MARATLPESRPFVPPPPPPGTTLYGPRVGHAWPHYDPKFVQSELQRYEDDEAEIYNALCSVNEAVAAPYRDGFLITFRWFLGLCNSPILDEPGPPATEEAYQAELCWARTMTENSGLINFGTPVETIYGGFNQHYVTAVYRTLRWVVASPNERNLLQDPMLFL